MNLGALLPISVSHIVEALASLGGEAHLDKITERVIQIAPAPIPPSASAIVRGRLQNFSSDTSSYTHKADLFQSVHGVAARRGVWRLRTALAEGGNPGDVVDGAEAFLEADEGRAKLRLHVLRERSRQLIAAFKASLVDPRCEACGLNFDERYGPLGRGYIEAHHRIPVASLVEGAKTKLSDLAALCANCHRVIHTNGLISVEELATHLQKRDGTGEC